MDNDFLKELQETFLIEAAEYLDKAEALYLKLETDNDKSKIIDNIFRVVHTLKGSAKSIGFIEFGNFAHMLENLINNIREDKVPIDRMLIDFLLKTNDKLKDHIAELNTNINTKFDYQVLEEGIRSISSDHMDSTKSDTESMESVGFFDSDTESASDKQTVDGSEINEKEDAKPIMVDEIKSSKSESYIRIPLSKIDNLLDCFGEQVILQSALEQDRKNIIANANRLSKTITQLGKITYDLHQTVTSLRMVNLKSLFDRIIRIVRDTSNEVGKDIEIKTFGSETELDKIFVDEISSVISHLIRNAIDHGIESQEERIKSNKLDKPCITINAKSYGGYFFLKISDNGRGLDKEKIKSQAIKKGIIKSDQEMDDQAVFNLIFKNGFSTASCVTNISGRGVGMDAVLSSVQSMRGEIFIESEPQKGSSFTIKLPLSLSIFNGIVFRFQDQKYILPSTDIKEIFKFKNNQKKYITKDSNVIQHGESVFKTIDLSSFLKRKKCSDDSSKKHGIAIVISRDKKEYCIEVDEIIGQQQIVQKKLGHELDTLPGIAGGAILGDGRVTLILNTSEMQIG